MYFVFVDSLVCRFVFWSLYLIGFLPSCWVVAAAAAAVAFGVAARGIAVVVARGIAVVAARGIAVPYRPVVFRYIVQY